MMRTLLVLAALVSTTTAFAGPSFEVVDHGDSLEVIAREMIAAKLAVTPVRSRLEVPLVGQPVAERVFPAQKTIRQIELDGNTSRSLSVKLDYEREDVRAIAPHARVTQVGNDLHLVFPKKPGMTMAAIPAVAAPPAPVPAVKPVLQTPPDAHPPALPPAPAAGTHAPEAHVEAPAPVDPAAHGVAAGGTAHAEAPAQPAGSSSTAATPTTPTPARETLKVKRDSGTRLPTLIAVILAAVGAGAWMLKRKKNASAMTTNTIDVLAQRSLGKHARVVWLSAGQRELIVAVTPQQVRVLGQWKPGDGGPPPMARLVTDDAFAPREPAASPREAMARAGSNPGYITPSATSRSPAISGLLKLREKAPEPLVPPISEDVASGDVDADLVWARELIAATGPRK